MSDFQSKQIAPFGSWPSSVSTNALTASTVGLSEIRLDGKCIYWLENRPEEKGRNAIVRFQNGVKTDVLPKPLNARSKVNEYGGGGYCVHQETIYFVLFDDQRIYRLEVNNPPAKPVPITSENACRYGDLVFDAQRQRLIAVCEDHSVPDQEPVTTLVSLDIGIDSGTEVSEPKILQSGSDFYASAKLSPDGGQLTWLSWDHPNMPWDGCQCWLADVDSLGLLVNPQVIAGGARESILQPQFAPDGDLYFVSDRNNWWNLFRWRNTAVECVHAKEAEFAGPYWVGGQTHFAFLNPNTIIGTYCQHGQWHLYALDISSDTLTDLSSPCCELAYFQGADNSGVFIGASQQSFDGIYQLDENLEVGSLMPAIACPISSLDLSSPQSVQYPLSSRNGHGHAFYYPPSNEKMCGPDNATPPLLVFCHGGPTSATRSSLNLKVQYWTSRGIAVADINYGGSTGFGRKYRESLNNQWGIVDVQDCIDCVNYLVEQTLADPQKVAIRGGSAGGYTVLSALAFHSVFSAGASHYGVGDLETLATDTHKFESHYLDSLVGQYPEQKAIYQQRSPINHLDRFQCPVIFFQGLQDKVVPPNQAEAMVKALDKKGIPYAYMTFEEEGHGFRQAPNQRRALEAELFFYSRVFNFPLADDIEPVSIHHLQEQN